MTFHLSHEQLCDHLLETTPVADIPGGKTQTTASGFHVVEDHLRACPLCAAELQSLQVSLENFQAATTSFANQELSLLRSLYPNRIPNRINTRSIGSAAPRPAIHLYQKPFVWAMAAGLVVAASVGSLVPHGLHHQPALHSASAVVAAIHPSTPTAESDQALLDEVDNDLSSNVPSAMQPLSDPSTSSNSSDPNSASSAATTQDDASAPLSSPAPVRKITHE
jgi:hypothetical protein